MSLVKVPATTAAVTLGLLLATLAWGPLEHSGAAVSETSVTSAARAADGAADAATQSRRRARRIYWGAWIGEQLTGTAAPYDMGAVAKFERMVRKRMSLVEFAVPFAECHGSCNFFSFPAGEMNKIRGHGSIPVLSWSSASIPGQVNEPAFQLSDLIQGRYDAHIRSFARSVKRWGHPFFLRFNWEMNSDWFPWGIHVNGNRPRQYVPAWRHVHRIFSSVGANNASWVWCPYVDIQRRDNLRALYPGGKFVDWTCLDGYNWGPGSPANPKPWRSFGQIYRSSYRRVLGFARRKPMILAELASSDYGGSKARWIRNMLSVIPRKYRRVRGIVWFDVNDRNAGWPIETSPAAVRAFRRGINRSVYAPNRFGKIRRSPIRPPVARR